MKSLTFAVPAVAAAVAAASASAQAVLPGYLTDPSAVRAAAATSGAGYRTPESLKFPYVSTYYVKPVVTTDEKVALGFFVTDFDSSKIRFLDDSFRFDVFLEVRGPSATKTLAQKGVKSGDGRFDLGRLAAGDYRVGLWARDAQGRESHRVWQEFRVRAAKDLAVPASKVYAMTAADLKAYGVRNDGDFGRRVDVTVEPLAPGPRTTLRDQATNSLAKIDAWLKEHPHVPAKKRPGYAVYVPRSPEGRIHFRAFERVRVVLDPGYDTNAVEQAAIATAEGLQRLLDDKAKAGFRRVVLLPGCYRVSARRKILVPDFMTLDLNGATLKENAFTGASSVIVDLTSVDDAHLVNGVLEGDYYEHDYANSPNGSEWPLGFTISAAARYCSVERVTVRDITGYGGGNGIAKDARGGLWDFYQGLGKFVAGGLDPKTGQLDEKDAARFTTDFLPLEKAKPFGSLQVSKILGYQGRATRSWHLTACWYDAGRRFLSGETLFQYRVVPIPEKAAFLRVSVEEASAEAAEKSGLAMARFRVPVNCAVKDVVFDRCRCVGYAASAMKNMLFEGNAFRRSGEALARCAFDAEDGWDQMQDVTFRRNVFRDNPVNNSILTCAGHNFVMEGNTGDIHLWGRTYSPCVRDNDLGEGTYYCDGRLRSGYGRFENNRYSKAVRIPDGRPDPDWDYVLSRLDFDGPAPDGFKLATGRGGRLVACRFANRAVAPGTAYGCVMTNCLASFLPGGRWQRCTATDGRIENIYKTNEFARCTFARMNFNNFSKGEQTFTECTFRDCTFTALSAANVRFVRCTFENASMDGGYWAKPAELGFFDCKIAIGAKSFLRLGQYNVGRVGFSGCTVSAAPDPERATLLEIGDLRSVKESDPLLGQVAVKKCRFASGTKRVVSVDGSTRSEASKKRLEFRAADNALPAGATFVAEKDVLPDWKVK